MRRRTPEVVRRSREFYKLANPGIKSTLSLRTVAHSPSRESDGETSMVSSLSSDAGGLPRSRARSHSSPDIVVHSAVFTTKSDEFLRDMCFKDCNAESLEGHERKSGLGNSIKTLKRRTKAGLLEWTGRIPETVDPIFELLKDSFSDAVTELRDLNRNMRNVVENTKIFSESSSRIMQGIGVSFPGEKTKGVRSPHPPRRFPCHSPCCKLCVCVLGGVFATFHSASLPPSILFPR
jgi:hypothetical protein